MKQLSIAIVTIILSISFYQVSGQGNIGIGATILEQGKYEFKDYEYHSNPIGINLNGSFKLYKKIYLSPTLNYSFSVEENSNLGNTKTGFGFIDLNIHYHFFTEKKLNPFILMGPSVKIWSFKYVKDDSFWYNPPSSLVKERAVFLAGNVGAGLTWKLKKNFGIYSEIKYSFSQNSQLIFSIGICYIFNKKSLT